MEIKLKKLLRKHLALLTHSSQLCKYQPVEIVDLRTPNLPRNAPVANLPISYKDPVSYCS